MLDYRIYLVDAKNRIIAAPTLVQAEADHDALRHAGDVASGKAAAEVWQGARLIGRVSRGADVPVGQCWSC